MLDIVSRDVRYEVIPEFTNPTAPPANFAMRDNVAFSRPKPMTLSLPFLPPQELNRSRMVYMLPNGDVKKQTAALVAFCKAELGGVPYLESAWLGVQNASLSWCIGGVAVAVLFGPAALVSWGWIGTTAAYGAMMGAQDGCKMARVRLGDVLITNLTQIAQNIQESDGEVLAWHGKHLASLYHLADAHKHPAATLIKQFLRALRHEGRIDSTWAERHRVELEFMPEDYASVPVEQTHGYQ